MVSYNPGYLTLFWSATQSMDSYSWLLDKILEGDTLQPMKDKGSSLLYLQVQLEKVFI